jgi:murein DD-endopeptidase MepM/ murein hydrolase activator NlpD
MRVQGLALVAMLLLSGCIPRGAGYDINNSSEANKTVAPSAPVVLVPEAEVVKPTPSWSPATVQRNAQSIEGQSYVVRAGDNLYRIGNTTGAGADAIARANGLTPPYALKVGQTLQIPGGVFHRVAAGETGIAIARAYAVPWASVVSLNGLTEPFTLRSGQFLRLPETASTGPVSSNPQGTQQMADAFTLNIDDIVTGSQPAQPEPGRPAATLATPITKPVSYAGAFGWPLSGRLASTFGSKGGGRVNHGIDIAAPLGTNVGAAGDGVVVYAGNEISVFGGLVLVDHGGGWVTAYGHLGSLNVVRGDKVRRGQTLGGVGNTGYVDTPQLNFQIRKDRKPIDPMTKLPAR